MSFLKDALKIVQERDPLHENYGYDRKRKPTDRHSDPFNRQGKSLKDILSPQEIALTKRIAAGEDHGDLMTDHEDLYNKLYDFFVHEMPVGTAKARDGDPDQWIIDHVDEYI